MYRPTFETAARAIRQLQVLDGNSKEALAVKQWLSEFDARGSVFSSMRGHNRKKSHKLAANSTLELLHDASLSRGLPHRALLHLFHIARSDHAWCIEHQVFQKSAWNPHLDPGDSRYKPGWNMTKNFRSRQAEVELESKMWNGLDEVMRMAEGRDNVFLGEIKLGHLKMKEGWR